MTTRINETNLTEEEHQRFGPLINSDAPLIKGPSNKSRISRPAWDAQQGIKQQQAELESRLKDEHIARTQAEDADPRLLRLRLLEEKVERLEELVNHLRMS